MLCILTRWDFNFCVRSSPLRGLRGELGAEQDHTKPKTLACLSITSLPKRFSRTAAEVGAVYQSAGGLSRGPRLRDTVLWLLHIRSVRSLLGHTSLLKDRVVSSIFDPAFSPGLFSNHSFLTAVITDSPDCLAFTTKRAVKVDVCGNHWLGQKLTLT